MRTNASIKENYMTITKLIYNLMNLKFQVDTFDWLSSEFRRCCKRTKPETVFKKSQWMVQCCCNKARDSELARSGKSRALKVLDPEKSESVLFRLPGGTVTSQASEIILGLWFVWALSHQRGITRNHHFVFSCVHFGGEILFVFSGTVWLKILSPHYFLAMALQTVTWII